MNKLGVQIDEKDRKALKTQCFLNRLKVEPYTRLGVARHQLGAEQGESYRETSV